MAKTRGGAKRPFKSVKDYRAHLREMAKMGKCFNNLSQTWDATKSDDMMHKHLMAGYKFGG